METKFRILLVFWILALPVVFEFLWLALPSQLQFDNYSWSIYVFGISVLCTIFYVFCRYWLEKFQIVKYLFLTFILRVFLEPFFKVFKMSVGLIFLCKRTITPSEEHVALDLLVDVSRFILLIILLRFKIKDLSFGLLFVLLSLLFEMLVKYILLNV